MTTPRLADLQRRLANKNPPKEAGREINNDELLDSLSSLIESKADSRVKTERAAKDVLQAEVTRLREENSRLQQELKTANQRVVDAHTTGHAECDRMMKEHKVDMGKMQSELVDLRHHLMDELEGRAAAEAQVDADKDMITHLKTMLAQKPKATAAPQKVIMPPAAAAKPYSSKVYVTERDANGHILALSITPVSTQE